MDKANSDFLVMYHGAVVGGRGIETLIQLVSINPNIKGLILGNGDESFIESLKSSAAELGVLNRCIFHSAVPHDILWKYVGAADVGLILAQATCKNHLYSLPNKFFENIQAGTPVVCPFYPAMKELVDAWGVGLTCDPEDLDSVNECVERLRNDRRVYDRIKKNIGRAKNTLCWEREREALLRHYEPLFDTCN